MPLIKATILTMVATPVRFIAALRLAVQHARPSDRPFPVHLIYLMEACTVHGPEEFFLAPLIHLAEKICHAAFIIAISFFGRSQLLRLVNPATGYSASVD